MNGIGINYIPDSELSKHVHQLVGQASMLKQEIFKSVIKGTDVNKNNLNQFFTHINEFLKVWTDYADEIQNALKSGEEIKDIEGIRAPEYELVKNFIYAKYDYSSVIKYTEGLLKGIEEEKFNNPTDIEDFKDHTIDMAFNKQETSVAGLLDSVLRATDDKRKATALEIKQVHSLRTYGNLFKKTDRNELYKAVTKVIEYVVENDILTEEMNYHDMRLFVSFVNNFVEYITYSLVAYACRVYVINRLVKPFFVWKPAKIVSGVPQAPVQHEWVALEHVNWNEITENPNGAVSSVFRHTDESIIKDWDKSHEFFKKFEEFTRLTGSSTEELPSLSSGFSVYVNPADLQSSKLYEKLATNPLCDLLRCFGATSESHITEFHQSLKHELHSHHIVVGYATPRNEVLHIIRGTEYGESLKDYQNLSKDLYLTTLHLLGNIDRIRCNIKEKLENTTYMPPAKLSISAVKLLTECTRFLNDWYKELAFACAQKAGFIERRINELRDDEIKKVIGSTSLEIKGWKPDTNLTDYTTLSVPSTTRMPIGHMDLYSLPVFEYYEMYDEYLRGLPEFKDDLYLSEADAGGNSGIINFIISAIQGAYKKALAFFDDARFKSAKAWVASHKDKLTTMKFKSDLQGVLPYKWNGEICDKFVKGLSKCEKKNLTSKAEFDEFKATLYDSGNSTIKNLVEGSGTDAATKYKNLILFGQEALPPAAPVKIAELGAKMAGWADLITKSDTARNSLKADSDLVTAGMSHIKQLTVQIAGDKQKADAAAKPEAGKTGADISVPTAPGQDFDPNSALNEIKGLMEKLWLPLPIAIVTIHMEQYKYLKSAYALADTGTQAQQPTQQ